MRLRTWGIALLVAGVLAIGAGIYGLFNARDLWQAAEAGCAGSTDAMCGAARTYAAAALMVLAPLASLGGIVLLVVGGALLALGRWLQGARETALDALAALADLRARPPND